ncbi:hypothetical protein AN189_17735 [Loktanella sp. 3ANDIMAR09]|uniref:hypothetical protein n=1 Tax=Loktanella sp. 3ANDIMAR09 TaxID=1225657 RepID=UPI0006FFF2C3|nr:hypothetical protein [Loktanella sp. 3ANDIMAR09]KQI67063.1 hypothetical protein AN189_17735 [Loktanella sp. 3ANDIMAR09]
MMEPEHAYSLVMKNGGAAVVVSLDLAEPVEIHDFVSTFAGLGGQFERFLRAEKPDLDGEVKVYVKEVRKGSMEAVMVIASVYPQVIAIMDHLQIASSFVARVGRSIDAFKYGGGRLPEANKTELSEIMDTVMATANDPDGRASIRSVSYSKDGEKTDCLVEFNSAEARQAVHEIEGQFSEIAAVTDFDHINKLLTFYQSNRKDSGKTGEKGIIEDISTKPLSVVYASDLARERIKSEMLEGERNIYKLGFFVDVNVATKNGKPVAYRIKSVNDVIELPDDD